MRTELKYKSMYIKYFKDVSEDILKSIELSPKDSVENYFAICSTSTKKYKVVLIDKLLEHIKTKGIRKEFLDIEFDWNPILDFYKNHINKTPMNKMISRTDNIFVFEYLDIIPLINPSLIEFDLMFKLIKETNLILKDLKLSNIFSIKNFGYVDDKLVYFDIDGITNDIQQNDGLYEYISETDTLNVYLLDDSICAAYDIVKNKTKNYELLSNHNFIIMND